MSEPTGSPSPSIARVIITAPFVGIFHMQVCATLDATDEEILSVCNAENPSGTEMGWAEVIREANAEADNMKPVVCATHSDRRHFLVMC
jgi:hypothetical protein